jgi:hypothetical protein
MVTHETMRLKRLEKKRKRRKRTQPCSSSLVYCFCPITNRPKKEGKRERFFKFSLLCRSSAEVDTIILSCSVKIISPPR